ncbi:MAG: PadR family transcriptional regulator [Rhodothermaceae bacterium]
MKLLSRQEEMLLLAVWKLEAEAYGVKIKEHLMKVTGKDWAFGALFVMLDRLVNKGYLKSHLADPTPERGGRSKRIYNLTESGRKALIEIKTIEQEMWRGIEDLETKTLI